MLMTLVVRGEFEDAVRQAAARFEYATVNRVCAAFSGRETVITLADWGLGHAAARWFGEPNSTLVWYQVRDNVAPVHTASAA